MAYAFDPEAIWQPFGAFSQLVIAGKGQPLHLKGQVALNRDGIVVGKSDMRAQLRQVLDNIQAVLKSVGGEMTDVLSLTHFTTDIAAFIQVSDIRSAYFRPPYPATTTVEVKALYHPDLMLEITAAAEVPRDRFVMPLGAARFHGGG
ncbi:RidA family protein [Salipiger mucosus]|uniref:Putative translation initiation inhibitor, yjgF family n=1 Tax=Salipiger mucosus DSM 16094 TaxID=1123237 RepID=S9REA9_9RHOB|nr:RidA family protein [Salipiger mucosus]EPX76465.1 Putative translation initiation inhibitor, yjgF family [Salipiger mucosus DSM 16094]